MRMKLVVSAGALVLVLGMTPLLLTHRGEQHEREQAKPQEHHQQASRPAATSATSRLAASHHGGVRADGPTHGGVHQ